uniref:ANF_receptor domain-containing protein n=1 Tax=Echinostoma caproni TaxID=27848 RepID=A0A183AUU6_9TREM
LANFRKKLIVSPTVATARFLGQQHYSYFFRTVPSLTEANCILVRLFLSWGWKRMVVFRKVDHFFNPRLFQAKGIEIIADIEMQEDQLSYEGSKHTLKKLKQRNSRIFVVEYGVRGTYLTLCAAYHQGMHFGAGYVWFLNPWLADRWWLSPITQEFTYCTPEQMLNITSWTFTVGHQFLMGRGLHSLMPLHSSQPSSEKERSPASNEAKNSSKRKQNTSQINSTTLAPKSESLKRSRRSAPEPSGSTSGSNGRRTGSTNRTNRTDSKPAVRQKSVLHDPMRFYSIYTEEAVILLASAMVQLLKDNPSAVSALDQPAVAEAFRNHVSRTNFAYRMRLGESNPSQSSKRDDLNANAEVHGFGDFGFQRAGEFYGVSATGDPLSSQLRFNKLNERVADYWLLKQRQDHTTVPLFLWFTKTSRDLNGTEAACDFPKESSAKNEDYLTMYEEFLRRMDERQLDRVDWNVLGHPPHDGSVTNEVCALYFLSDTLRMGCTGATVFVAVIVCAVFFIPVILLSLHYRRKLREAEQLTRKPFEELCAELADLDNASLRNLIHSYRKLLVDYVAAQYPPFDEHLIMKAEVDILMPMHLVKKTWVSVHPHVLINAFMKAGFKSTLIQPVMQPLEDKCDLIEDFTHYVSTDYRLFEEEIARLEFEYEELNNDHCEYSNSTAHHLPPNCSQLRWRLIRQCCQHDWKSRPSSMDQVLDVLKAYPECIRPFLTDDPPKPITMMDSLQVSFMSIRVGWETPR